MANHRRRVPDVVRKMPARKVRVMDVRAPTVARLERSAVRCGEGAV